MKQSTNLSEYQRLLLAAVKGRLDTATESQKAKAEELFAQRELGMLREVLLWWRLLGVSRICRFTASLLRQLGRFDSTIEEFVRCAKGSASLDVQASLFLEYLYADPDRLVAAVARSESALMNYARDSSVPEVTIRWPQHPEPVFEALLHSRPLERVETDEEFLLVIGTMQPRGMNSYLVQ